MADDQNLSEVLAVRREKLKKLRDEGKDPFKITKFERTSNAKAIQEGFDDLEGKEVVIAGRIMSKRGQGKVGFYDLQDHTGRIQLFLKKDLLDNYDEIKTYDIGDIVGVTGEVFRTKRGEISVRATDVVLLSKSLQILPEKWHGLKDTDLRYRQRYVDLIVNPEVKDVFVTRSKIITKIRHFLDEKGFLEVETPILSPIAGGANARPFITHHNALDIPLYLRIALELPLKRLIVGGFDKVYEISRVFRNEGMDATHNPEFTLLETYAAYEDYEDVMNMVEELYGYLADEILGTTEIEYGGNAISLARPFKRARMVDLVKEYTGIDFDKMTLEEAVEAAKPFNVDEAKQGSVGEIISEVFDAAVEDHLIQPTFVTMHPVEISPLAKKDPADPRYTQRFELFINGAECANAFSELNDPIDQKERFIAQVEKKAEGDDEAHPYDADFINALEVGLPPTGGLGIGIDRLVMLFTGAQTIRDAILFPTMKPLAKDMPKKSAAVEEAAVVEDTPIDFSKVVIEPLFEEQVDFDTFSKSDFRAVKIKNCEAVPKSKKLLKFTLDDGTGEDRIILSGISNYYEPEELIGKTAIAIVNLPPRKMMGIDSCGMLISAVHEEEGEERLNLLMVDDHIPAGAKLY